MTRDEQIEALLTGHIREMVREHLGESPTAEQYESWFMVSRGDVLAHVQAHGWPKEAIGLKYSTHDGPYLLEEHGRFAVFVQERGIRFEETQHDTHETALAAAVDVLLDYSGMRAYLRRDGWLGKLFPR